MPRNPAQPRIETGLEHIEDTDMPIEELAAEVLSDEETEFLAASEDETESSEDTEESKTREKWQNRILFQNYEDAAVSPPTREDGSEAIDDDGKPIFKIFVVKYRAYASQLDQDPDNLHIAYVWARNTQESIVVTAEATFEFSSQQYGAKRGRRKLFKPDENIVKLANLYKSMNDSKTIAGFLEMLPDYAYIFSGESAPEFATQKKVLAVKK